MTFGPGKPPSKQWRALLASPFARDTLAAVLRGLPTFRGGSRPPSIGADAAATTLGDTITFHDPRANVYVLSHEAGHVLQGRHLAPMVEAAIVSDPRYRPAPGSYSEVSDDEHIAEAFARAMASGRRSFADSTQADRDVPGSIEFIHWLQTRPPFAPAASTPDTAGFIRRLVEQPPQQ